MKTSRALKHRRTNFVPIAIGTFFVSHRVKRSSRRHFPNLAHSPPSLHPPLMNPCLPVSSLLLTLSLIFPAFAAEDSLEAIRRELDTLKKRVATLEADNARLKKEIDVERLIVRKELLVSDT